MQSAVGKFRSKIVSQEAQNSLELTLLHKATHTSQSLRSVSLLKCFHLVSCDMDRVRISCNFLCNILGSEQDTPTLGSIRTTAQGT